VQSGTGQKGGSYFSETFSFPTDKPSPSFFETKNFSRVLVLIAAALYGTNFAAVKILDTHVPIAAGASLRFGLAALACAPFLFSGGSEERRGGGEAGPAPILAGLEIGAWNSAGYLAQAVGLETTDASKSAFICSLAVVVVPLLDFAFGGKKLGPKALVGCALAVLGVATLETQGGGATTAAFAPGDLATFFQPLAFGVGFWRMEKAMHKHPGATLKLTASQLLAVAGVSAAYMCMGLGGVDPPSLSDLQTYLTDPSILAALAWTGVVTTAFTVWLETLALGRLSAAETTLLFSTEPVWGSAFAAVVMGEAFGPRGYLGGAMILFACLYSSGGLDAVLEGGPRDEDARGDALLQPKQTNTSPNPILTTGGGLAATSFVSEIQGSVDGGAAVVLEAVESIPPEATMIADVVEDLM